MFHLEFDDADLQANLRQLSERQIKWAAKDALDKTAGDVLAGIHARMDAVFDRPTPFTKGAFVVQKAHTDRLEAVIHERPRNAARDYLKVQEGGGPRPTTGLETVLRSRLAYDGTITAVTPAPFAKLNAYGNWDAGERNKVMSGLIEWATAVMAHAAVPPSEIVIAFTHGETNRRDPWAGYVADGLGYMVDIEADLAFNGLPVVWLIDVPGGTSAMSSFGSDWQVKFALRELMRQARLAGHTVIDVGPRYHLPMGTARGGTPDHIHLSYLSQIRLREQHAYAYRNHVAGLPWWCAVPRGERASRLGSTITLSVDSLTPIMIDPHMVALDPHYGFSLSDSTAITAVTQTGDREISITVAGTPAASAKLQYVYRRPTAGEADTRFVTAAGSIREVWHGVGPISGEPVYRPMHSFEVSIV